jgi:gas vesicle structural protein
MAIATAQAPSSYLSRSPNPSGLADVLNIILDKGLVIDAYVRVSLVGIELLTIDARIVIASVDTYLRFAEAVNRLDLTQTGQQQTLPGLIEELQESGASKKTKGVLEGAKEKIFGDEDEGDDDKGGGGNGGGRRTRQRSRASSGSRSSGGSKRSSSKS